MNRIARRLIAAVVAAAALPASASASPEREPRTPPPHTFAPRAMPAREPRELGPARGRFYAAPPSRAEQGRFDRWHAERRGESDRRWGYHSAPTGRR